MDSLLPGTLDVIMLVLVLASIALWVIALVSLARVPAAPPSAIVFWALAIIFVPACGSIAWFTLGRPRLKPSA